MNWAASSTRGSQAPWLARRPRASGVSSARLELTWMFIPAVPKLRCRTQHEAANHRALPNHCGESRSTRNITKRLFPEVRLCRLQYAAEPHGADFHRKPTRIVG